MQFPFAEFTIRSVETGSVICEKGTRADQLHVVLEGECELFTRAGDRRIYGGTLTAGRSLNLFSVLRGQDYQYSAQAKNSVKLLVVPAKLLKSILQAHAKEVDYLKLVTEDGELRSLAKLVDSLGCSTRFKIDFLSMIESRFFAPQEWITAPDEPASFAFSIAEGQLTSFASGTNRREAEQTVPARVWFGLSSLSTGGASTSLIKAVSKSRVLTLSKANFESLRSSYADDLERLLTLESSPPSSEDFDDVEQEIDLDELINRTKSNRRPKWKSYPWVRQNDQMDCGPACLAMISTYFGRDVSIQFWRNELSTNREGTSLFDLAKTTERCGYTSCALEVEDLRELDPEFFPAIVLRDSHYMVAYEVDDDSVSLGDPAVGLKKLSHEDFKKGFSHAVLFLRPNESFDELPTRKNRFAHYFGFLRGLEKELLLNACLSVVLVAFGLFTPILSQVFLDDILVRRDLDLLALTLGVAVVVSFLTGFVGWARAYYANYMATKFDFRMHSFFIKKTLGLPYKFVAERHIGDFTRRLQEMTKVKTFLLNSVEKALISLLSLAIYSAALLIYSPKIALAVFISTPIFFALSWFGTRRLNALYQTIFNEGSEIDSQLTDTIRGISTVKSQGAELASRWRYEEKFIGFLKADRSFKLTAASLGVGAQFYAQTVNFGFMGLAAYLSIKGDLTPGQVVAVTMIAGRVLAPFTELASQFGEVQEIASVCERLDDILLAPSEKSSARGRAKKDFLQGEIEFRDVWFRYGGESSDWVLKGVSFKIEPGQNVAFVGPSGSGKSTLALLLTRMYEPTRGQILIDGRDYRDYDLDWLRAKIGVLHQDNHLFAGTILENIGYSDPNINLDEVARAAAEASALEFILKKPGEFNFRIAPGGAGLAGGEKQRIALARVFYQRPHILLLDEATSALDGIAEADLLGQLKHAAKNATVINIAHRYSTVRTSDFALVLFGGRVVGFGHHEQLLAENEIYRRLFASQVATLDGSVAA